jgi:hypothetical protein
MLAPTTHASRASMRSALRSLAAQAASGCSKRGVAFGSGAAGPGAGILPAGRLSSLRQLMAQKNPDEVVRILEVHNGLTGLIAEHATATRPSGEVVTFDGMWSSSLTASASKGKPDIETVDTSQRLSLVQDSLDVSTKPLIYDADTGWLARILVDPLCP